MELLVDTIACRLCKSKIVVILVVALSVLSCTQTDKAIEIAALPFYNTAEFDAEWIDEQDTKYECIHTIENFALQNQSAKTITKDSLDGFIYVANFFFTSCPSICPKMTNNMKGLQKTFANNPQLKLVSFSVMPWFDTVEKLNEYGQLNDIDPSKWYLLTGDKDDIYNLARSSYFAEKSLGLKKSTDEFLHTESMVLIDKNGRIRGIYNATQKPDFERIIEDIDILLNE